MPHNALTPMPAPATHGAPFTPYERFASLTPSQKAAARALYHSSRALEMQTFGRFLITQPLLDCWFRPTGDVVSTHGFFTCDPRTGSVLNLQLQY